MAITLVQSLGASGNSGTSASVSGLAATTAGNLLVALVSTARNPGDVTFTPPANWVQIGTTFHDDVFISVSTAVYYYPNNPGGITSAAFTISAAASAWHVYFLEFSGIATTSPADGTSTAQFGTGTTPASGAITTTAAGDLIIGWSEIDEVSGAGDCTVTQPGGYTGLTRLNDGGGWLSTFAAWTTQAAAGSINYQPTKSRSDTEGVFTIAAFKAAGGGGSIVNGSAALVANSVLTETPGAQLRATAALAANSALTAAAGTIITPATKPAVLQANAVLPARSRNLLSENQSSVETDTTGFGSVAGSTLATDATASAPFGSAALKVVTDGLQVGQGFRALLQSGDFIPGAQYTLSLYLKGSGTLRLLFVGGNGAAIIGTPLSPITLTGTWTRYTMAVATFPSGPFAQTTYGVQVDTAGGGAQAVTFWADGLQVEQAGSASAWTLGGAAGPASVVEPAAVLQATSVLALPVGAAVGPAVAVLAAESVLSAPAARIVALSAALVANAILSATPVSFNKPGRASLTDGAVALVALTDTAVGPSLCALSDAALARVALSDREAEV